MFPGLMSHLNGRVRTLLKQNKSIDPPSYLVTTGPAGKGGVIEFGIFS